MTGEGWRTVDLLDIVAVYRGDDDEPGGTYVSAVLVMVGGKELAGIVRADALRRVEALIAEELPPAGVGSARRFGTTAVVPIPAALPLFASGLGVMGWFARRKKRMAAAEA